MLKEFNLSEAELKTATVNECGNIEFTVYPDSPDGYTVEYDPETGLSRHCGFGAGCFWTDWE